MGNDRDKYCGHTMQLKIFMCLFCGTNIIHSTINTFNKYSWVTQGTKDVSLLRIL